MTLDLGEQKNSPPVNSIPSRTGIANLWRGTDEAEGPAVPALFEADAFFERLESRLRAKKKHGTLAYVEIQNPYIADRPNNEELINSSAKIMYAKFFAQISEALGEDDIFCWHDGHFVLLFRSAADTPQILRKLARQIARCDCIVFGAQVHLTPAIGYVDLRMAETAHDLAQMAETALDCAKSSLEMEPFRYVRRLGARYRPSPFTRSLGVWGRAPQWLALSVQFFLSLAIGLGAPFVVYAVCDALGFDISGPVYLGVVAVLVITASMIWIEGFLALKPTAPPLEPGSPYPPATVIIPAYLPNEADTIIDTVKAFLRLDYPNTVQIIIAYNSPRHLPVEDELQEIASRIHDGKFLIEPIRVAGSTSKAQNVNAVIGNVRGRFVGIFDADHHPRPDSIRRAWRWLSNGWDIVQGRCSIRNGGDSWVSRMVAIEFEQIYAVSHPGRARFHGFGIFGGSNGFWRTSVLHETRMRHTMLTEDIDSSIRAVGAGYKIVGDRDLVSEELAPTVLSQLLNQRLRWAQGWFQVSLQRVIPTILSPQVSFRQKLGLIHLLIWRELFPWYSIQVVPIMAYWVWAYGWHYIQWSVPLFVATTIFTFSTGPAQILFAYLLAEKPMKRKALWFLEYLVVSTFFFSPFKDTLSRIAHLKEAMRERAWRVTPRSTAPPQMPAGQLIRVAAVILIVLLLTVGSSMAKTRTQPERVGFSKHLSVLLGGEVTTINAARNAAKAGNNAEAASLFEKAINAVPSRRPELLGEYADALTYAGRSAKAVPLYREMLASASLAGEQKTELKKRLALALTWSSQFPAALKTYDDLLAKAPGDEEIVLRRAVVLTWMNRSDEAVAALDRLSPAQWSTGVLGTQADEILMNAARQAARTDRNEVAADLFSRAIRHNSKLKVSLLREYADQLQFSNRANDAIPLYKEVIDGQFGSPEDQVAARLGLAQSLLHDGKPKEAAVVYTALANQAKPGTDAYKKSKRGLSLALTWSNRPVQALDAWNGYLNGDSADVDAMVHKAQILANLHRSEEALRAYKAAYAMDRKNAAARRGVFDETVNLARMDAKEDKNAQSAALFLAAMELDPHKRKDLLREYADQLNFGGRSQDAVPLYREVLASDVLSDLDRKRASKGLADALAWSNQPKDALATYSSLAAAYPDDDTLQWTKFVYAARQAAQLNKNKESADQFARAISISSVPSAAILREYADQLSFTDRSAEAVSYYRRFLEQPGLTNQDRLAAQKGLAQAYDWSGDQETAKQTYRQLIAKYPDDISLRWNLLVASAHQASQKDRNKEAAGFFADAIRLVPDRRGEILKEYADQLSFSDRASEALPLYREVLNQPSLSEEDRVSAAKGLAQAYDWSDRPDQAKAVYGDLRRTYPADVSLQWGMLVSSAHQEAKQDRNKQAAVLLAQAIRLMPSRRAVLLKEYADKLAFSDNAKDAIPLYRELIEQGGPAAGVRSAKLALALALAWDHQFTAAVGEYQRLIATNANDVEARTGLAQTFSWSGHQSDSKAAYEQALAIQPRNPEAMRGLAQVEDWQGHHQAAQALLSQRIADDPNDLQARRLLAQSLIWMGRPDRAMDELNRAIGQLQASITPDTSTRIVESAPSAQGGVASAKHPKPIRAFYRSATISPDNP